MCIYVGDKQTSVYKGNYLPLQLYKGNTKIAGWTELTKTGIYAEWENTYNDHITGSLHGNTTQLKSVWGTNIVTNGDFSAGASEWVGVDAVNGGAAEKTATVQYGSIYQTKTIAPYLGHMVYFGASVKADSNGINISLGDNVGTAIKAHSGSNTYERLSVIRTVNQNGTLLNMAVIDYRASDWTKYYVDNAICIDLTAVFGAGKEPTAPQIDDMLSQYPGGWFSGKGILTTDTTAYTPNSPSPDYPAAVSDSVGTVTTSDGGSMSSSVSVPALCRTGGVSDTLEYVGSGVWNKTKSCSEIMFDGTETGWGYLTTAYGVNQFYISVDDLYHDAYAVTVLSTHYIGNYINNRANNYGTVYTFNRGVAFNDNRFTTVADWKSWLAGQFSAGMPVTVKYRLETPVTSPLHLGELKTYPRRTIFTQSGSDTLISIGVTAKAASL